MRGLSLLGHKTAFGKPSLPALLLVRTALCSRKGRLSSLRRSLPVPQIGKDLHRNAQISKTSAQGDVRLIGAVEIAAAGRLEPVAPCQPGHGSFIRRAVGGIERFHSVQTRML